MANPDVDALVLPPDWVKGLKTLQYAHGHLMAFARRHHDARAAVEPQGLQPVPHLPGVVALRQPVGQRRARNAATQLLQPLALVGGAGPRGVQAEAQHVGTQHPRASAHRPGLQNRP